jgi:hypothetical protein
MIGHDAAGFARKWGVPAADWMAWPGWRLWIGCLDCFHHGPAAPCWGRAGCHGLDRACGCAACAAGMADATDGGGA